MADAKLGGTRCARRAPRAIGLRGPWTASDIQAPLAILIALAANEWWSGCPRVREALLRNVRTPVAVARKLRRDALHVSSSAYSPKVSLLRTRASPRRTASTGSPNATNFAGGERDDLVR